MLSSTFITLATAVLSITAAPVVERAQTYNGRGTFYAVGLGNCGWSNSASDKVVALNTAQYGSTSQKSGSCGQTITVNYNGKSQQAQIVDSCPTCPYGGLDMSTSLFSALTNGNMGLGEIQVSWHYGSGSGSSSGSGSGKSSGNDSKKQSKPSASSSSSSSSKTSSTTAASAATPTNTAEKTVTGVPQWWADVGTAGCPNVKLPDGAKPVSVAYSGNAEKDTIADACGKWVQIWNNDNNKTTKAVLTNFNPEGERNTIYMGDAYLAIADMTGDNPSVIQSATWGFLN